MVSQIEMKGILGFADKYVGKEVTITLKGYVSNVELINDIMDQIYTGGSRKPVLLGQRTVIDLETTDTEIEIL